MAITPRGSKAVQRLIEVGVIPPFTTKYQLNLDVNEVITATITRRVTEEELQKIAEVFAEHPEETRRFAEEHIFATRDGRYVKTVEG